MAPEIETPNALLGASPSVSVVIPAFNQTHTLARCLHSLFAQEYPKDRYEIVVVDDGSTDDTAKEAQRLADQASASVRILRKPNGGPASARNAGIRASTADIIAFMDADCAAEPDWLNHLVSALTISGAAGVGGPIVNHVPRGWVADYLTSGNFFRHRVRRGQVDYLLTANVVFRRSALLEVGGFAQYEGVWGEDADLSFRLKQAGHCLILARQGLVTHFGTPANVRSLARELYRYGRGNAILSSTWKNGRNPASELMRHGVAVELAVWLALARTRVPGMSLLRAVSFWPLILVEHGSFMCGMVAGLLRRRKAKSSSLTALSRNQTVRSTARWTKAAK